jgi:Na+-driven multidrug efflux pump
MNNDSISYKRLNKGCIFTIMALAIPTMIENILQVLIGTADTYFVSKIGTEAVAAVGITNLIMNIYIAFFIALGVGSVAIVSRNIGANEFENANNAVKQSIILALGVGISFGIINFIFAS